MPESLDEYAQRNLEITQLRDSNIRLQQQLRETKAKTDRMVEAAHQGALDAMVSLGPVKPVKVPARDIRSKKGEAALLHLTDWQLGKLTPSYNTEVAKERVMRFMTKTEKITQIQRADHPVRQCVILFGGDMIEGVSFQFPTQPFEIDSTLFAQYAVASRLMVDVIQKALSIFDKVKVISEYGNHGRIGSKRDVVPNSDNLDRMCYHLARELLHDEPRLDWKDGAEDIQRVELGAYRALLVHGDEVGRGGFASPSTMIQHVNRWKSGAYPWDFTDVFCGHFHSHMEMPMANGLGALFYTGSTESENRYARDTMAASALPSQRLHFIDPVNGFTTSQYRIRVT